MFTSICPIISYGKIFDEKNFEIFFFLFWSLELIYILFTYQYLVYNVIFRFQKKSFLNYFFSFFVKEKSQEETKKIVFPPPSVRKVTVNFCLNICPKQKPHRKIVKMLESLLDFFKTPRLMRSHFYSSLKLFGSTKMILLVSFCGSLVTKN